MEIFRVSEPDALVAATATIRRTSKPTLSPTVSTHLDALFGHPRMDNRPSWDERFMRDALNAATMSTCPRASVGCVLVRDKHLVVAGHNGAPRGLPHCTDVGCMLESNHCIRANHAEQNAITEAARRGVNAAGTTLYVTHHPCALCAKMLINLGVVRVVYLNEYVPADNGEFLRMAGIPVERIVL